MKGKVQTVFRILLIIGIVLLTITILTMLLCAAYLLNIADDNVSDLVLLSGNGGTPSMLYAVDAEGNKIEYAVGELSSGKTNDYAELESIPLHLQKAFIAIEDKRFYSHIGFDPITTFKAAIKYIFQSGRTPGGSTITQQLIKNLTGEDDVSITRKLNEIMRAVALEKELSKDAILELYLNSIYLSNGTYGVKAAAKLYFDKDVSQLNLIECACIAAITQAPSRWDPIKNPENNRIRRDIILKEMYTLGYITEDEFRESYGAELTLSVNHEKVNTVTSSWYTDAVINESVVLLCETLGISEKAATQYLYNGGYQITVAVNPKVQEIIEKYYKDESLFSDKTVQSSFVVIDPQTGGVLGVAGGIGTKSGSRILNRATQTLRSPGSSIKPLSVFLPALEMDKAHYGSSFDDVPLYFTENTSLTGWPENANRVYYGNVSFEFAVARSLNTVSVRLLDDIGIKRSYAYLESLGITTLDRERDKSHSALALGGMTRGVSLLELTQGYTALANNGVYSDAVFVYEILDRNGNVIVNNRREKKIVASEENVQVLNKLLQSVITSNQGTAYQGITRLTQKTEVAGKTGTTDQSQDRWFIGYTPELLAGIWLGYDEPATLSGIGGKAHLQVWDTIMNEIYNTIGEINQTTFDNELLVETRYCCDSGMIATEACYLDPRGGRVVTGYFSKNTVPSDYCDTHILVSYCDEGMGVANTSCPRESCHAVGLLLFNRSFPVDVTVRDSQYTAMKLPDGYIPYYYGNEPYFKLYLPTDHYVGKSEGDAPYNRACSRHIPPTDA